MSELTISENKVGNDGSVKLQSIGAGKTQGVAGNKKEKKIDSFFEKIDGASRDQKYAFKHHKSSDPANPIPLLLQNLKKINKNVKEAIICLGY